MSVMSLGGTVLTLLTSYDECVVAEINRPMLKNVYYEFRDLNCESLIFGVRGGRGGGQWVPFFHF